MPAPSTCTVSGVLYGPNGVVVEGVVIKVYITTAFTDVNGNYIPAGLYAITTSSASGTWSLAVIRTATLQKTVTFQFEYPVSNTQSYSVKYAATIPEQSTANFSDIVDVNNNTSLVAATATTDLLPEGVTNLYFTEPRVRATPLTGFVAGAGTVAASDTILQAINKLAGNSSGNVSDTRLINTTAPLTGGGDLSADRTIAIPAATSGADGYLTSADWSAFNAKQAALGYTAEDSANKDTDGTLAANSDVKYASQKATKTYVDTGLGTKQASGNYITALTGDVTASGPGSVAASIAASTVTGKLITGFVSGAGTVASTDTILQALNKLDGNIAGKQAGPLTGDVTTSGAASTLATVNSNVGSFTNASITVNAKGLITAASNGTAGGDVSSNTATAVDSEVALFSGTGGKTIKRATGTGVAHLTSGVLSVSTVTIGEGGTGQTTKAAAFDALSPMSASGDIIYGGASGTGTRLVKGSDGDVLTLASGVPSWAAASGGGPGAWADSGFTTSDFAGMGTVSGINIRYLMIGTNTIWVQGNVTFGTPSGATATMTIPNSKTASASYANPTDVGRSTTNTATAYQFQSLAKPSDTKLYFGIVNSSGVAAGTARVGTDMWGAGQILNINAIIQC